MFKILLFEVGKPDSPVSEICIAEFILSIKLTVLTLLGNMLLQHQGGHFLYYWWSYNIIGFLIGPSANFIIFLRKLFYFWAVQWSLLTFNNSITVNRL